MSPEISLPAETVEGLEWLGRRYGLTPGEVLSRWVMFIEKNEWVLEPFYMNMPVGDWPKEKFEIIKYYFEVELNR